MTPTEPDSPLTTIEVARLLQVHPKQVYRLLRQGLPGRRLGGEWRFLRGEVIDWMRRADTSHASSGWVSPASATPGPSAERPLTGSAPDQAPPDSAPDGATRERLAAGGHEPALDPASPPFVAANGDIVIEVLLEEINHGGGFKLGFIQADRGQAIELLDRGEILAAGCHGGLPPTRLGAVRLARIHLVNRQVGLAAPAGARLPALAELGSLRFATRPGTAGITTHLKAAAEQQGLDPGTLAARGLILQSHRDVVCAVARGEADIGLTTAAWAHRLGLAFKPLAVESYGLLVRAADLGDARVVRLCEVAQSPAFRDRLAVVPGYDLTGAGDIRYDPEPPAA